MTDFLRERLHDRRFVTVGNPHGVSGADTVFHYRVAGARIWGTYQGGRVAAGHVVARATGPDTIETLYHAITTDGALLAGARGRGRSGAHNARLHVGLALGRGERRIALRRARAGASRVGSLRVIWRMLHRPSCVFEATGTRPAPGWAGVPVFGSPRAGVGGTARGGERVVVRPSAYVVIADGHGRVALVQTPGGVYLPGGVEPGETWREAAAREALEECGLAVVVGAWVLRAVEHVDAPAEATHFEKRCTFVDSHVGGSPRPATEPDYALRWLRPAKAAARLTPAGHRLQANSGAKHAPDVTYDRRGS